MPNKRTRYLAVTVLLAFMLLMAAGCASPQPPSAPGKAVIKLVTNPWLASEINAAVAKILLEEEMGHQVEIVPMDEYAQWEALAKGEVHASLEVWASGHGDNIQKYIEEQKTVENGGSLGPVGKIAWYIPSYLERQHPELATWRGLQDPENAALFATPETGSKGRFLTGDPSWTQYDDQIINNLGLNFQVVRMGSEEALLAELETAYKQEQPILLYFWTPHWAHTLYDLVPVELPPYSDECYARQSEGGVDCDYPADPLFKIFWSDLSRYSPSAYQFLKNMSYSNLDQIAMLAMVQLEDMTPEEAARAWLADNEQVWKLWIPEP